MRRNNDNLVNRKNRQARKAQKRWDFLFLNKFITDEKPFRIVMSDSDALLLIGEGSDKSNQKSIGKIIKNPDVQVLIITTYQDYESVKNKITGLGVNFFCIHTRRLIEWYAERNHEVEAQVVFDCQRIYEGYKQAGQENFATFFYNLQQQPNQMPHFTKKERDLNIIDDLQELSDDELAEKILQKNEKRYDELKELIDKQKAINYICQLINNKKQNINSGSITIFRHNEQHSFVQPLRDEEAGSFTYFAIMETMASYSKESRIGHIVQKSCDKAYQVLVEKLEDNTNSLNAELDKLAAKLLPDDVQANLREEIQQKYEMATRKYHKEYRLELKPVLNGCISLNFIPELITMKYQNGELFIQKCKGYINAINELLAKEEELSTLIINVNNQSDSNLINSLRDLAVKVGLAAKPKGFGLGNFFNKSEQMLIQQSADEVKNKISNIIDKLSNNAELENIIIA